MIQAGTLDPRISTYDAIIVAASVHHGRFQESVTAAMRKHGRAIALKPNAFVAVCLGALRNPDPALNADLRATLQRLYDESGWTPMTTKPIAGALAYSRFNLIKRWLVTRMAPAFGAGANPSVDPVYTDWDQVRAFAEDFSRQAHS